MSGPIGTGEEVRKVRTTSARKNTALCVPENHVILEKGGASRGGWEEVEPA